ncbi:unnamed protein product [Dicrocoelium dendriticum]|nr:unnamed protein product [Dicrocoelium dendriticum]
MSGENILCLLSTKLNHKYELECQRTKQLEDKCYHLTEATNLCHCKDAEQREREMRKWYTKKIETLELKWSEKYNTLFQSLKNVTSLVDQLKMLKEAFREAKEHVKDDLEVCRAQIRSMHERSTQIVERICKQESKNPRSVQNNCSCKEEHSRVLRTMFEEMNKKEAMQQRLTKKQEDLQSLNNQQAVTIEMLRATVQRECEEREELKATLLRTREHLLHIYRDPNSKTSKQRLGQNEDEKLKAPVLSSTKSESSTEARETKLNPQARIGPRPSDTRKPTKNSKGPPGLSVTKRRVAAILSAAINRPNQST